MAKLKKKVLKNLLFFLFVVFPFCVTFSVLATLIPIISKGFIDPRNDTTTLTNIGFGVLAALSSISFSWARAIDPNEKYHVKCILGGAEYLLAAALFFLLASGLKYACLYLNKINDHHSNWLIYLFLITYVICFLVAVVLFVISLMLIGETLSTRLKHPRKFVREIQRDKTEIEPTLQKT